MRLLRALAALACLCASPALAEPQSGNVGTVGGTIIFCATQEHVLAIASEAKNAGQLGFEGKLEELAKAGVCAIIPEMPFQVEFGEVIRIGDFKLWDRPLTLFAVEFRPVGATEFAWMLYKERRVGVGV